MTSTPEKIRQNMVSMRQLMSQVSPHIVMEQKPEAILYESDLAHPVYNRVVAYHGSLSEGSLDGMKRIANRYRERQVPFTWLTWSHDTGTAELGHALEAIGLKRVDEISGMSLPLTHWSYEIPATPGFTIQPIRVKAEMAWFKEIVPPLFGFEGVNADVLVQINEEASIGRYSAFQHYVGFLDGQPAGVVTAVNDGETIGIYNVAILNAYRRRGLGTALTVHALREGKEAGSQLAVLQASKLGEDMYRAIGFNADVIIGFYLG